MRRVTKYICLPRGERRPACTGAVIGIIAPCPVSGIRSSKSVKSPPSGEGGPEKLTGKGLLGDHFERHFQLLLVAKADPGLVGAQFFHFFQHFDVTAVYFIAFLSLDSLAELQGGDASEYLA